MGAAADSLIARLQQEVSNRAEEDVDILIADGRYGFANTLIHETVRRSGVVVRTISDKIDRVVLNRLLGIPIFLAVMYLLFTFTINVAGVFQDFFDMVAGALFVDGLGKLLAGLGSPGWLTTLLAGGVGGGLQTVASFIPVIGCLYLFLSFLEDSGYMARAAFVMDRFMRTVGLPGKSFIPLIVGFGCNVPAIMATRTLEHRRERIITVMMAPFMSCGARLPVYALFVAAFFPTGGQNVLFSLYVIGIGFAVLTGLALKNTLLAGEAAPFVMELPPYHVPTLKSIVLRTWDRLKAFLFRAGKVIVAVVVVLSFLNSWGTDGSFGNEGTDRSVLAAAGKAMAPVVEPMGIREDNWPATLGLLTGILAKETVVGTLNALYSSLAEGNAGDGGGAAEDADLWVGISAAFATIPANAAGLVDALADPLGLSIADTPSLEAAAERQNVAVGTFGAMAERFDGRLGAFAYLLAVLLYMPCISAVAAVFREVGARWAVFASLWTTGLGYGAVVVCYQAGTFAQHPSRSTVWIGGIIIVFLTVLAIMRLLASRDDARTVTVAAE